MSDDNAHEMCLSYITELKTERDSLRRLRERDRVEFIKRAESVAKREIEDLQRIAELEAVAEAAEKYRGWHHHKPDFVAHEKALDDALRAAGYLGGGE